MSVVDGLYLSNVFKYIQQYGIKGHTIGRKIGDLVELLTYGYLCSKVGLVDSIRNEKRIEGFSGAEHKVEFVIIEDDLEVGLIECKRVGVEVTVLQSMKTKRLSSDENVSFAFSPRALNMKGISARFDVKVTEVNEDSIEVTVSSEVTRIEEMSEAEGLVNQTTESLQDTYAMEPGHEILFVATSSSYQILGPNQHLDEIDEDIIKCRFAQLKEIRNNKAVFDFKEALPGPQTIEKAKQIGFVALDVRKRIQGKWGKEELSGNVKDMFASFLVLAEVSHWEEKSRKCVRCALDHVVYIPDVVVVDALERLISKFGEDEFRDKIRVKLYDEDAEVKQVIDEVVGKYENRMFRNLDDDRWVEIDLEEGHLILKMLSTSSRV